ncbi:hypothetical protein FRC04_002505 [Tulasnella sp. 424]|nr:hypothetical protein FRC04_002505 [Tulasnella sp. 424]
MTTPSTTKLAAIPQIPPGFGEDGGIFYKYYDDLADELDDDMVTSLKSQLDGILIFAGLFAGVNSAFLAFTLPQMSPDPTDDTNALLFQIMLGGNSTIRSPADLPSASFSPTARTHTINVLFSMSLTLALLGSFLAVLGQQWLVYYRKRSGGGADHQRWEQLRRYLGAKRWRLELVLDDILPSVLQVALVIFCVAFILYLGTLSGSLCYTIAAPLCVAGATIVMTAMCAAWDRWCPFKSPLSHLIQSLLQYSVDIAGRIVGISGSFAVTAIGWLVCRLKHGDAPLEGFMEAIPDRARDIAEWFKDRGQRPADATDQLKVIALKRVLCTSEDSDAIVHAATNAQSISQGQLLGQILNDDELRSRFETLDTISFESVMSHHNPSTYVTVQNTAISRSLLHIILMAGSVEDFLHSDDRSLLKDRENDPEYLNELVKKLYDRLYSMSVVDWFPVGKECAECSHCVLLRYCMKLVPMIVSTDRPNLIRVKPDHLKRPMGVIGSSKGFGPAWIEAWAIKLAKEWDDLSGGEAELTPSTEVRRWQLGKLKEFLGLYQNLNVPNFAHTISEAIAISTVQWSRQPETEVYVGLFEQDIILRGIMDRVDVAFYEFSLGFALKSLVTLLHSFERRIRDPELPAMKESLNETIAGRAPSNGLITSITRITSTGVSPLYHCVEASATLKPYLELMSDITKADPGSADNPSMIKMMAFLFSHLTDPEESVSQIERVELSYKNFKSRIEIEERKIEDYRQFYPVLAKTVREIDFAVRDATSHSSKDISPE